MRHSQLATLLLLALAAPACGGSTPAPAVASAAPAPSSAPAPLPPTPAPEPAGSTASPPSASAPAPSPTAAASPAATPTIPVVAVKIIGTGKMKGVIYELRADGTLVDKAGKVVGRIDGRSVAFGGADKPVWAVDDGGNVTGSLAESLGVTRASFDDKNALVLAAGDKRLVVAVDGAGQVRMSRGAKTDVPPCTVEGMTPAAARAVELLVMTIAWPK